MARISRALMPVLALALASAAATRAPAAARCGFPFPAARELTVPPGFVAQVYASGLDKPTAMAYGPDGFLYVTEETRGVVRVGRGSCNPATVATGFSEALGLAWVGRRLYVSSMGRVTRLDVADGRATSRRTILSHLPNGEHQQDNVVLGPDGRLYLGNGSTCNACRERDRRSATILSFRPDGSDLRVVATGLRNPYGIAFRPGTRTLYATVNGRDDVDAKDDPEPAETVVRVRRGAFYGWPDCWPSARLLRLVGRCAGVEAPAAYLEPHAGLGGLVFYDGRSFPAAYRGDLFVAEWGQYLAHRFGRRVVRVRLAADGARSRVSAFASGFDHPLAVAIDPQGALLVADHGRGSIYRIEARART